MRQPCKCRWPAPRYFLSLQAATPHASCTPAVAPQPGRSRPCKLTPWQHAASGLPPGPARNTAPTWRMMAAPPVGISKICSFLLSQVITWNSSTCAWLSRPPAGSAAREAAAAELVSGRHWWVTGWFEMRAQLGRPVPLQRAAAPCRLQFYALQLASGHCRAAAACICSARPGGGAARPGWRVSPLLFAMLTGAAAEDGGGGVRLQRGRGEHLRQKGEGGRERATLPEQRRGGPAGCSTVPHASFDSRLCCTSAAAAKCCHCCHFG